MDNEQITNKSQITTDVCNDTNGANVDNPFQPLATKFVTESYHEDDSNTIINETFPSNIEKRDK